jgi:Calcineurin-like phosphoesterase
MQKLTDAGIPWIPAIGNHDTAAVCPGGSACPDQSAHDNLRRTATFNQYFPVTKFPGVNGMFESGKVDNTWSSFVAGEEDWLVLNLELWPRTEVISWARGVIGGHPHHNVVIVTHSYLNGGGGIEQTNGGYGDTSPQYMYENLVAPYRNVKLVFSGHVGTAGSRTDARPDGSKVVSVLGTFHSDSTNPTQIMTVDTAAGTLSAKFYAPWDDMTWPEYGLTVSGMRWASGVDPSAPTIALRAMANRAIVTAEAGGARSLIANRTGVGPWERFAWQSRGGGQVAVRALVNQRFVTAEAGGAQPLIANRRYLGDWETFDVVDNPDGTISLRSRANSRYVTAEAAGGRPLIANRTSIGPWEKFQLIRL